jgi:hypothetical protein
VVFTNWPTCSVALSSHWIFLVDGWPECTPHIFMWMDSSMSLVDIYPVWYVFKKWSNLCLFHIRYCDLCMKFVRSFLGAQSTHIVCMFSSAGNVWYLDQLMYVSSLSLSCELFLVLMMLLRYLWLNPSSLFVCCSSYVVGWQMFSALVKAWH